VEVLREKAEEISRIVSKVEGVADLRVEQTSGQPYLIVDTDRDRIARYGINVEDINEIIETAIGGKVATVVLEGDKKFQVVVRFPEERRNSVETVGNILVRSSKGADIPLAQLARISVNEGPVQIGRENARRRIIVECNVEGRDIGGFVAEAQKLIAEKTKLPSGYYITWGGAFENQQRAMKRPMLVVPLTIG
jgi:cobalt-zinc-cadmium resistance protein CzcA